MDTENKSMIMGLDGEFLQLPVVKELTLIEQEGWMNTETREITWKYRRADRPGKGDAPAGMPQEEAFESGFTITVTEKWVLGDL